MNKIFMRNAAALLLLSTTVFSGGCGYTTQSLLPSHYKSIYVDNFKNGINVAAEQSNLRMYRGYTPGMETTITKAVRDRYLFDGNLKVSSEDNADVILRAELIDFKRDVLRYDVNNNVQEYRVKLIINMKLEEVKTGKVVWEEKGFAGETDYTTQGTFSKSENAAIDSAIADLAKRIVERTVEAW